MFVTIFVIHAYSSVFSHGVHSHLHHNIIECMRGVYVLISTLVDSSGTNAMATAGDSMPEGTETNAAAIENSI